jgi:putative membrane protein
MNKMTQKTKVSIGLIWLFTISGILGITSTAQDWFLALTPLNLFLSFAIILIHTERIHKKILLAFSIPFFLGFITEALGVNYGLLFGNYSYGSNLGLKVAGVPVMICINWVMLTVTTADLAKKITPNKWVIALIGAFLMTLLDAAIEVSAPRFDFWEFEGGVVPLQNYIAWFCIAFTAHMGYQIFKPKTHKLISMHVLVSMFVFFTIFLFV